MEFFSSYGDLYRQVFGANEELLEGLTSKTLDDLEKLPKEDEKIVIGKSIEAMVFLAISDGDLLDKEVAVIQTICQNLLDYQPVKEDLVELSHVLGQNDYDLFKSMTVIRGNYRKAISYRIMQVATPMITASEEITEAELQGLICLAQALGLRKEDAKKSIQRLAD